MATGAELSVPLRMSYSMDHHDPIALEYATRQSLAPPSDSLRRTTVLLVNATGGVGIAILCVYAMTGVGGFTMMGFLWLFVGAIATFAAFIIGLIYAIVAHARGFPSPATRKRALWAVLLPMLNVAVAIVCVLAGIMLMSLHHRRTLTD
jgi:hypothetical protein